MDAWQCPAPICLPFSPQRTPIQATHGGGSNFGELAVADARDVEMSESSALVEKENGEAAAAMARSRQTVELRGLCKTYGELQA